MNLPNHSVVVLLLYIQSKKRIHDLFPRKYVKVSNLVPLTPQSDALPTALTGPVPVTMRNQFKSDKYPSTGSRNITFLGKISCF